MCQGFAGTNATSNGDLKRRIWRQVIPDAGQHFRLPCVGTVELGQFPLTPWVIALDKFERVFAPACGKFKEAGIGHGLMNRPRLSLGWIVRAIR